jgi:TRAP transporter TAXI family solute receptor
MKSRNRVLTVFCLAAFVAALTGLTLPAGPADAADLPKSINIGTHAPGSYFNIVGTGVAKVVGRHTPMKTKVNPTGGPVVWMPMMVKGEIDMGVCNIWDANKGYLGESSYKDMSGGKGFPVRLVTIGGLFNPYIVVAADSGIKTVPDLKGKRVAAGFSKVPSVQDRFLGMLANGNLTMADVKLVPVVAPAPSVKAVTEGKADAGGGGATGMAVVTELDTKRGALALPLDPSPAAMARLKKYWPFGWVTLVKGGTDPGVKKDTYLLEHEIYLLARADLSEEAVYAVWKAMWEHNDELRKIHEDFARWTRDSYMSKTLSCPYHAGSVKFLKEKGLWTPETEKIQQELLKKMGQTK